MPIEVRPVASKRELKAFMRLPWRLYRNEPNWVPPLLADLRKRLDREHNPFFAHAEAEYFLAWREDRPVGRITAQIDRNFNELQGNDWGLFGFFEGEAGLPKAMDSFRGELPVPARDRLHPSIWEMAEKVQSEHGITGRPLRRRDLQAEVPRFPEVNNAGGEPNWGFVPLTEEGVRHY